MPKIYTLGLLTVLSLIAAVCAQYRWGSSRTAVQNPGAINWHPDSDQFAEQKSVMPKMPETYAVRFVSAEGNDTNDGLSWTSAKHTIYGALVSLPGGGMRTAGSGTVSVGPGGASSPTPGGGIWLMGPNDPNFASPPPGWLKCNGCTLNIIGVGNYPSGPNGHRPRVLALWGSGDDRNHPGIWLSATSQPIYIANFGIQYPGRGVVIGECSNNDRTGKCGSQSIVLDNVSALPNTRIRSNGPCTDIVSNVFWVWMRDYGCGGLGYAAKGGYTADNAAAILIDASVGQGSGQIYIVDTNLGNGGIKNRFGANGGGLYVKNLFMEGDYSHPLPPAVWFTSWGSSCDAYLENIQQGDGVGGSPYVIETDAIVGTTTGGGPTVMNSGFITGPATVINPKGAGTQIASPLRQGQTGFFDGYVVGQSNSARRIAGLVPTRFANKVSTDSANWECCRGGTSGVTFTPRQTDPFGGTGAAKVSQVSSVNNRISFGCTGGYAPTPGDWIVEGVWVKGYPPTNSFLGSNVNCYGSPGLSFSLWYFNKSLDSDPGEWTYWWNAYKVAKGIPTSLGFGAEFNNKITPTFYGPSLYIIPAGTLSDNEVLEFANTMSSVDSSCAVGSICNMSGHPVVVSSYGTLSNCTSAASPAKCGSAPAGSFVLSTGSTTVKVNTTAVTAASQIVITEDASLGARLGVACNKAIGRTYMITERAPGLGFSVASSVAPTDHPACLSFELLN